MCCKMNQNFDPGNKSQSGLSCEDILVWYISGNDKYFKQGNQKSRVFKDIAHVVSR